MADVETPKLSEEEVFELRSPKSRNELLSIEVVLNGSTKEYTARLGTFYGTHKTLAEALHQLANRLDGAKVYGSENFEVEEQKGKRLRCCDYCGSPIFFALTHNNRWMPVDGTSIDAADAKGVRAFGILDNAGRPKVESLSRPRGQVWIAHPDVCGATETVPPTVLLRDRWEENRKRVEMRQQAAVADLQSLVTDLEEG